MGKRRVAAYALAGACLVVGGAIAQESEQGFALPKDVVSAATAFEGYMSHASAIDGQFSSGAAVAQSMRAGAGYEPAQLEEGMIAYGAIAALQDDAFVNGVVAAAGRGKARQDFAERLVEDPYAAARVEGAGSAARRVERALAERAAQLMGAAGQVKSAAYAVQGQAWSKVMVDDAPGRLAEVKTLSAQRSEPSDDERTQMMTRLSNASARELADAEPSGVSPIEARSLALAAEAVLDRAHATDEARLAPLFTETSSAQCLRMAKLNLYQCMAVAGPEYEDIFCLGQHAMYDTGACVSGAVRGGSAYVANDTPATQRASYIPLASHRDLRP